MSASSVASAKMADPAVQDAPSLPFVVAAATTGTVIEWYDFYIYGTLASFFSPKFFPAGSPATDLLIGLATFATGFMARPIGAVLFGRYGDLIGRKITFLLTLIGMGGATALIGVLPDYNKIGMAAPVLLVLLRLVQGLALGGEYGGGATYIAEHAPEAKRGAYTSWIQMSSTIGFFVSLLAVLAVRSLMADDSFRDWGWRIPFLASIVLVVLSLRIRMRLRESPLFERLKATGRSSSSPAKEALGSWANWKQILIALFGASGPQAIVALAAEYYVLYFLLAVLHVNYITAYLVVAAAMIVITPLFYVFATLSDRVGRRPVIIWASIAAVLTFVPLYYLIEMSTAHPVLMTALVILQAVPFAAGYAPCAALLVEMFPARLRYTMVSVPYHIAGGVFAGLVPFVGVALVQYTGNNLAGLTYPVAAALIGFVVALVCLPETSHVRIWDEVSGDGR